jgi:DNA adenine methylase
MHVKPFLKWAGGKRWFVARYSSLFPTQIRTYIEPFLGSAALFFYLRPDRAILGDKNEALIETYQALSDDWRGVWRRLKEHQERHNTNYYYEMRKRLYHSRIGRAAKLVYLNRTCFNGLYRVNRKGQFNVPKGTKDTVIFPDDDFGQIAALLRRAEILCADFSQLIKRAAEGDFVYVDPPYTVQHNNNSFLKYNEPIFSWADQVRLARCLHQARDRGAQILMSNADHPSVRELYCGFDGVFPVRRNSVLAADSGKRGATTELVVTNIPGASMAARAV